MNRFVTAFLAVVMALMISASAFAQTRVTIRDINHVPQANIDELNALGASATPQQVKALTTPTLLNQQVVFTAVVLSDPYNSGFASWNAAENRPGRVHVFVRDTSAMSMGFEGMGTQLVDATGAVASLLVGDVIDIVGTVTVFGATFNSMQITPTSFQVIGSVDPSHPLMQPVSVTTPEIHRIVVPGGGLTGSVQINWNNYRSLNGQYVRVEGAQVIASVSAPTGRPAFIMSTFGTENFLDTQDFSLRYRNDRVGSYANPPYNTRPPGDPYEPPAAGTIVNVQGFLVFQGSNFNWTYGVPAGAVFSIVPWEDEDLQAVEGPPIVALPSFPDGIPGNAPVTITTTVEPGTPGRTITSVELVYTFSTDGIQRTVNMTDAGGGTYQGQIPPAPDGAFVTYFVRATDNTGATSESQSRTYRVLYNGITRIEHIQRTATGGVGNSPFTGRTLPMNLQAVVMTDVATTGFLSIQDDSNLEPWSGIFVQVTEPIGALNLVPGDRITISNATVVETFAAGAISSGTTTLTNATLVRVGSVTPYAPKTLPTGLLAQDPPTAEAHEGMLLRFDNVIITSTNPDGPQTNECVPGAGFGEWAFVSAGAPASDAIRADDESAQIPCGYNVQNFVVGQERLFMQGIWFFSFGNFKLAPRVVTDIGPIGLPNEAIGGDIPTHFALEGNYPNPFNPSTLIRYAIAAPGHVTLKVYDVTGREVATLVDGYLTPSVYQATFDASDLATGVYFYRLAAGGQLLTGKMLLVK
jgi:hypothetical protein